MKKLLLGLPLLLALIPSSDASIHGGGTGMPPTPPPLVYAWSASLVPGTLDINGAYMGGTEILNLLPTNINIAGVTAPRMFASVSYVDDTNGNFSLCARDPIGVAGPCPSNILELDGPTPANAWYQNIRFSYSDTAAGVAPVPPSYCWRDHRNCSIETILINEFDFTFDSGKNAVNKKILMSATWDQGHSPSECGVGANLHAEHVQDLNIADGIWYQQNIVCGDGNAIPFTTAEIRSMGAPYTDQVIDFPTPDVQYVFAGTAPNGIFSGQLNTSIPAGASQITWATSPEMNIATDYPNTWPVPGKGSGQRVTAITSTTGSDNVKRDYAIVGFGVFVRVDGDQSTCAANQVKVSGVCQTRWQPYWLLPGANGTTIEGPRGLSVSSTGHFLIGGAGSARRIYNLPALPGCASITAGVVTITSTTCAVDELGTTVATKINTAVPFNTTGGVVAYNDFPRINNPDGSSQIWVGNNSFVSSNISATPYSGYSFMQYLSSATPPVPSVALGTSLYLTRSDGPPVTYAVNQITNGLFATPLTQAVRTCAQSPFSTEPYAVYCGHFDYDITTQVYFCKNGLNTPATTCPASPTYVALHETNAITRYGP